jgi:hypothetical protein
MDNECKKLFFKIVSLVHMNIEWYQWNWTYGITNLICWVPCSDMLLVNANKLRFEVIEMYLLGTMITQIEFPELIVNVHDIKT